MQNFFIDPDISKAKTIHTDFYTSQEVFELCKEKIFAPSWQFICSTSLLDKNNVYPFTFLKSFLDEPMVLTKDQSGVINLLSNVCTHRGNIISEEPCNLSQLRCRYHGRKFQLDGKFISMPEFKEVQNFPSPEDDLTQLKLFHWKNWLFTSLKPIHNPEIFLRDMIERVKWMPLEDFIYHPELTKEFNVKCNWAVYCENYLEGFHIPFVHSELNTLIDFNSYTTEIFFPYSNLQIGIAKNEKDSFKLPQSSPDYGKNVAAYYFWIFPNLMFNFYPWGLSVNIIQPVTVNECRVTFQSYVWDESKLNSGAGSSLDQVELEDEQIVENVQKGVKSRFYTQGRYSVTKERGPHHFHSLITEFLK
jgi:choline monooxygenase